MFQHARKSGAKIFDEIKISSIDFTTSKNEHAGSNTETTTANLGRPVSAS